MKRLLLIVMIVCWMLQLNAQQIGSSESVNHNDLIIDEEFFKSIPEMVLTRDAELKSNRGKLPQFIPKSAEEHAKNTDIALRKLKIGNNNNQSHTLPEVFWTDVVTSQSEGYVVDDNGNIHIHSAEALAWLSAVSNGMYGNEATNFEDVTIILENDIDLAEANWTPIADESSFSGDFDGNGYTIYNTILTDNKKGFFCNLDKANIKNVIFRKAYVYGKWQWGGFLACKAYSSVVDRCFVECDYLLKDIGRESSPFINEIHETTVSNCMLYIPSLLVEDHNTLPIDSYGIGLSYDNSYIYNCAIIIDKAHMGSGLIIGFVDYNSEDCRIDNCFIHIREFVNYPGAGGGDGGLPRNGIAFINSGSIRNCYFNRDIYAEGHNPNIIPDFDNEAACVNDGTIEDAYYYFNENDYWQLKESIVYNENATDNLLEALNLGVERLTNEGYSCLNWSDTGMDFDNMGLPVFEDFEDFENILNITENISCNISIFPNPANHTLTIKGESIDNIKIYSILGQLIKDLDCNNDEVNIEVDNLKAGIYLIKISNLKGEVITNRISIKH